MSQNHIARWLPALEPLEGRLCLSQAVEVELQLGNRVNQGDTVFVGQYSSLLLGAGDSLVVRDAAGGAGWGSMVTGSTVSIDSVESTGGITVISWSTVSGTQHTYKVLSIKAEVPAPAKKHKPPAQSTEAAPPANPTEMKTVPEQPTMATTPASPRHATMMDDRPSTASLETSAEERRAAPTFVATSKAAEKTTTRAAAPASSSPSSSSLVLQLAEATTAGALQRLTLSALSARGVAIFDDAPPAAPAAPVVAEGSVSSAFDVPHESQPDRSYVALLPMSETTPVKRYFGYTPLGLPYTLVTDSLAAFVEDSARRSGAGPASGDDLTASGPWALTFTVLAADLLAVAYIHRGRLKSRLAAALEWLDAPPETCQTT